GENIIALGYATQTAGEKMDTVKRSGDNILLNVGHQTAIEPYYVIVKQP
ncbi:unnamed protein product, partial [marine sediment metagenome]